VTTLLALELRRLLGRRFFHLIVLAAIAGGAIAGLVVYLRSNVSYSVDDLRGTLQGTTVPLVMASWLLGASFIGAEWRAGTVTTLLTWEPRRVRVILSKAVAAALVAAIATFALQAAIGGMLLPAALKHGTGTVDAMWLRTVGSLLGRGSVLAAMAALVGFSVGSIGRNTAFGLGVGFVYLGILEGGLLGGIFHGLRRWLVVGNSIVFVRGRPEPEIVGRSVIGAGLLLSAYTIGVLVVAVSIFRTRDVT